MPNFECLTDVWRACEPEEFCKNYSLREDIKMRTNFKKDSSLHNWVEQYDMVCMDKSAYGVFGSLFFFGVVIGSVILPRLSDHKGRKYVAAFASVGHLIGQVIVGMSSNLQLSYACYFLMGLMMPGRAFVSYIWMSEQM